jgi:methylmalonyl-CoA/ethylmalonyl-CoA epimerase
VVTSIPVDSKLRIEDSIPMSAYLDHIGIAIKPDSPLKRVLEIIGLKSTGKEEVESEKVEVEWVPLPKPGKIELLRATTEDSQIAKYLEKNNKDGVHHLSFRVDSVEKISEKLKQAGFQLIYPKAKPGADGCMVNFVHPKSTGGVLIEITEKH